MKNYNKEYLLDLLKDTFKLHDEISESRGLVLFKIKQEKIDMPVSLLLCPSMSAWAIPYLNERLDELTPEQAIILSSVSSGNNYWVNNGLVPLEINIEPFEQSIKIDNPILDSFLNLNSEFIETKISLHRLAKSVELKPIKNINELKEVTGRLLPLAIQLVEGKFNSQYFNGKSDLVKTIVKAAKDGNYNISRDDIKQLNVSWVSHFSLEVFGNSELAIDVLDENLKKIVLNYEILKKSKFEDNFKRKGITEIGLKDNSLMDAKNLLYYLSKENTKVDRNKMKLVLDNFLKADTYLLDNCSSLVKSIVQSDFQNISNEQKYIGYLNYVSLIDKDRFIDVNAWVEFMKERNLEKLPIYYFWEITKLMGGFSMDLDDSNVVRLLDFMKDNISWSEFKGFSDIPGENFSTYDESSMLNSVLFKIYDDFKESTHQDLSIITTILEKYLVKMKIWNRQGYEDDVGVVLNHLIQGMSERGFVIKKYIEDNILDKDDFFKSDFVINDKNLLSITEYDYSEHKWSHIIEQNKKYNRVGLNSLHKNNDLIPSKVLNIFLENHLKNNAIKKYCENYLIKNWNSLPLFIISSVKDNKYPLLDKKLFENFEIDINEKYNEVYASSHFIISNRSNGFKLNLTQAEEILSKLSQYKEDDKFSHILFIGKSLDIFNTNEIYGFITKISNYIKVSVNEFNELLNILVFDNLSGVDYIKFLEKYKPHYIKLYSEDDYYVFLSDLVLNSKNSHLSYDNRSAIQIYKNSLNINCEKLINKLPINNIYNLLESESMADLLSVDLIKKVADRFNEIKKLQMNSYDAIFKNILEKKIDTIKKSYGGKENVHMISNDINTLLLNLLEKLKDNPAAYVLMWSSSKNYLLESWKYNREDDNPNNVSSSEYLHSIVCEHMDIDIFNQGIFDLKNKLKHLDNHDISYGELGNNQREYLEFEVFFRKIYSLTWASCKKIDDYFEYENKSLLSFDKKDKIWDYIESNFPEFLINMDACNVSDRGFNDVQFKDWNKIFTLLSQNSASDSNYRIIDLKNTDSMLNCFLNYDAESNVESLNYLQHIIFVALNSKNVVYQNNSDDEKNEIEEISSAIRDWYDVRNVKSSMLVKNIINNDMRIKEIQALSELVYLNNNVKSNDMKSNVFKV